MSSFNKHLLQSMCLTLYKLAQVPQVRQFQWAAILSITIGETSVVSSNKSFFFVWLAVCCQGLQTLTFFKAKSIHFATLFKTRDLLL